jgi:hypothetical protein
MRKEVAQLSVGQKYASISNCLLSTVCCLLSVSSCLSSAVCCLLSGGCMNKSYRPFVDHCVLEGALDPIVRVVASDLYKAG